MADFSEMEAAAQTDPEAGPGPEVDEAAHLDGFRADDAFGDDDAAAPDELRRVDADGREIEREGEPEPMSREAFRAFFRYAWDMPGMLRPEYRPLGITQDKREACDHAADGLRDLVEMYMPSLLDHNSPTVEALSKVIPFAILQVQAFRAIKAERIEARAANDNRPPDQSKNETRAGAAGAMDWLDDERAAA